VQDGKSGYLSQSVLPIYFGLDGAKQVDAVEVVWPSGAKQIVKPKAINSTIEVVEERREE
jgi:hypothetical protein